MRPPAHNKGKGRAAAFILANIGYSGDDCLMWPFSIMRSGYGNMGYLGKEWRAHCLMATLAHGERPTPKHEAAHSCHQPGCVNPRHLSWKTHQQNIQDKVVRGTIILANNYGRAGKLTPAQVKQVRELAGKKTQVEIGQMVGLSESAIRAIISRKTYARVE
jgi:DNA-binding CsgD family transcriptional regulator